MPTRIPPALYRDILDRDDLVVVILEQTDYLLKSMGEKSSLGFAAYSISQLKKPLTEMKGELRSIKGVRPETEKMILEILETGRSRLHEELIAGH